MAFVEFEVRRPGGDPLPKGVCSLCMPIKHGQNAAKLLISAVDALNHFRAVNHVRVLWDAATNTIGLRKVTDARGACKLRRTPKSSVVCVTLPKALQMELVELGTLSNRFYFVEDPALGFYTINLTQPAPRALK